MFSSHFYFSIFSQTRSNGFYETMRINLIDVIRRIVFRVRFTQNRIETYAIFHAIGFLFFINKYANISAKERSRNLWNLSSRNFNVGSRKQFSELAVHQLPHKFIKYIYRIPKSLAKSPICVPFVVIKFSSFDVQSFRLNGFDVLIPS